MQPGAVRALVVLLALGTMTAGAQPRNAPDVSAILMRVGERVQEYYARAVSVICLESVSLRQLGTDLTSDGSPVAPARVRAADRLAAPGGRQWPA